MGQVGAELCRRLEPGATLALDRAELDLLDAAAVRRRVRDWQPEVILNAAAYTAVDAAESDAKLAAVLNAAAPRILAEEAARSGALLVHYSTDYVFDGRQGRPYKEDDPTGPEGVYGRTKLDGERGIRDSGCRHLILRTSWIYASHGKNFLLTMLRLARERPALRVVADQRGSPTWARSLAEATLKAVDSIGSRPSQALYHLTGAGETTWHGFASAIVERGAALGLCPAVPVEPIATSAYPTPARRPAYSVLSCDRIAADFGVRLPHWQSDLDECLRALTSA
jgi:dTDP-4-dehydrorhamnose reductase